MKDITHATSLCQSLSIYVAQMAYHTSTDKDAVCIITSPTPLL